MVRQTTAIQRVRVPREKATVFELTGANVIISLGNERFDADGNAFVRARETSKKKYDLGFGYLGNGLTVWNRAEERNGDYITVAHIAHDRTVRFYDETMPDDVSARIENVAFSSSDSCFWGASKGTA